MIKGVSMSYRLKCPMKLNNEWVFMVKHFKNVPLTHNGFNFFFFEDSALFHDFESIQLACIFFPRKDHSTEPASPNNLDLLEIV